VILHVSVSEEIGYMYLTMTESLGKSCCWNRFIVCKENIFWNVSTRLQVKDESICDDGVSKLSGIEIREQKIYMLSKNKVLSSE
jgi:hypothetical protein